ncbi:MAG: hypothetical protein H0V45_15255, partial [Actinobacteria bacterium]|nr:hypothetical protein [Actinomycetota bacterium]
YLGAYSADALLDPLWRHFHDVPRVPGPSYLDALALVRELGIDPAVKVVSVANRRRFSTLEEAVEHYRDGLLLPDEPDVRRELERLLSSWLLGRRGALRSPMPAVPAAIIEWTPGAPTSGRKPPERHGSFAVAPSRAGAVRSVTLSGEGCRTLWVRSVQRAGRVRVHHCRNSTGDIGAICHRQC